MKTFFVGVKGFVRDERGILLIRHTEGHWDVPGGRMDGSETFEDTLRREIAEEVQGAQLTEVGKLLGAHRLQKDIKGKVSLVLLYFLTSVTLPEKINLGSEHAEHRWIRGKDDIPADDINQEIVEILKKLLKS